MSSTELAILFSDISGSTRLYDELGDDIARPLVTACMEQMSQSITANGGTVIKTIGDEVMCTLPNADLAATAAVVMQENIADGINFEGKVYPVSIRIGFHFGPVVHEKGDVYGDAVNIAARMTALAKGGQLITTKETVESMNPVHRSNARLLDRLTVKGKRNTIDIYEFVWQEDDATRIATGLFTASAPAGKLKLTFGSEEQIIDPTMLPMSMGRGNRADMMVNDTFASREHISFESRRDKFVLLDTSTNGTYIETVDGSFYLRREEIALRGTGKISLGRELDQNPDQFISFEIITQ
ncbi:MAG: adenylate/guanylate cyclase domain-containing protein [Gammaproteobacteria bacterium]|nr:MAG: adenylate/guanylate cyclase domain-containing protein [Gammaproteobacteria bacterium]RLA17553.1 MAG: adenylate/guanylate cyclase domain-containing protein [Gammaproteobacteria bacterium]